MTVSEREHVARVKSLPCSVCDASAPSDAHHIKQGQHWSVVALCKDCHQGALTGWHGQRRMWKVMKMDEIDALSITIRRVTHQLRNPLGVPAAELAGVHQGVNHGNQEGQGRRRQTRLLRRDEKLAAEP